MGRESGAVASGKLRLRRRNSVLRYTPAPDFGKGFCGGFGLGAGRETPMLSST